MRVRWTASAAGDLTAICDYTEKHDSAEAARRIALRIYEGIGALSTFPRRGRPGRKVGTRELVFSGVPFLVVYRVGEVSAKACGRQTGNQMSGTICQCPPGLTPRRIQMPGL
ncbi:MAG: type II toxin-antitoxin system RelE/ParE family toxin [Terriglobia bacterium]